MNKVELLYAVPNSPAMIHVTLHRSGKMPEVSIAGIMHRESGDEFQIKECKLVASMDTPTLPEPVIPSRN